MHACVLNHFSRVQLYATLWSVAHQSPLPMGFSRQEYWSGLPCPLPGAPSDPGTELASLCVQYWQAGSLPLVPPGKPLYTEYIMWNARLEDSQARIKIARRNTNNLRYADDTTLMAESEEELKSLLMRVKEESKNAGLKINIQKTKIMAYSPIASWQINGET